MGNKPFLKGWRTYLAIILTALVAGLVQIGIISTNIGDIVVTILSGLGLYFRSQA